MHISISFTSICTGFLTSVGDYDIGPGWFYTFLLPIYDILYGEKYGNLHSLGISLDLSYSLLGILSLILNEPHSASLYRSLGSNNIIDELAVRLVPSTHLLNPDCKQQI
jgi:hypothetical protein